MKKRGINVYPHILAENHNRKIVGEKKYSSGKVRSKQSRFIKGVGVYRLTFYIGTAVLIVSAVMLFVDQKTGWLISRLGKSNNELALSQIRQQRIEAIDDALKNDKFTYKFETSGDNFLTMPMSPNEEVKVKSEN